ncbi:MAG: cache domain-containing protein, partial [Parvibaculaceae bacterium]
MNIVSPTTLAPQKISPVADPALLPKPDLYRQLRLLLAGIVVPMLVLTLAIVIGVSRVTEERTGEGILQTARGVMASTDAELKGYIGAARLLSGSPALQAGDLAACQLEANRCVATFPGRGSNVVLSDREGTILLSVLPLKGPLKRANLAGVDQVFTDKGTYVSDMYLGAVTGLPTFTIDMPVVKDGEVLYALAFNPPRDAFFDIVDTLNLPDGWVISIFDRNNHHVARNPPLV